MADKSVIEAVREAIREEMQRDSSIFVMGETGARGGVFLATQGLVEEFGEDRIIDTPLAEASIVGIALGAGLPRPAPHARNPVLRLRLAVGQPAHRRSRPHLLRHQRRGQGSHDRPHTLRRRHSRRAVPLQNVETHFFHTPGLKVVTPCTPYDAKGLLKTAIRDDNPGSLPGTQEDLPPGPRRGSRRRVHPAPRRSRHQAPPAAPSPWSVTA